MKILLAIAAGGAFGALSRYIMIGKITHYLGYGFPWGTLAVNAVGSLILGALIETMALSWSPSEELRAFLVVGVLGAFTTFSAFSLDVALLIEKHNFTTAGLYILSSVTLSIAALFLAMQGMRAVLS